MITKNDVVYISGPMTGHVAFNYPAFNAMEEKLKARIGCTVLNPARNFNGDPTHERSEYMALDIRHVLNSTALVVLPGWVFSRGANLEVAIAIELGLPIYDDHFHIEQLGDSSSELYRRNLWSMN